MVVGRFGSFWVVPCFSNYRLQVASFAFVVVARGGRQNTPVSCEVSVVVFE